MLLPSPPCVQVRGVCSQGGLIGHAPHCSSRGEQALQQWAGRQAAAGGGRRGWLWLCRDVRRLLHDRHSCRAQTLAVCQCPTSPKVAGMPVPLQVPSSACKRRQIEPGTFARLWAGCGGGLLKPGRQRDGNCYKLPGLQPANQTPVASLSALRCSVVADTSVQALQPDEQLRAEFGLLARHDVSRSAAGAWLGAQRRSTNTLSGGAISARTVHDRPQTSSEADESSSR